MRIEFVSVLATLAFASLSPLAQAAPAAPVVTVGADIKQLQFDWDQVPTSNSYELWFKANAGAAWIRYSTIPAAQTARIRINVSVHLLDWRVARYRVAACNPSGCTNSAEVGVSGLALDAIGYFKPQAAGDYRLFGQTVALSADGKTFAVLAGDPVGLARGSATVTIYRKTTPTGGWRREIRLVPSTLQSSTAVAYTGTPLAISGDGNVVVLGLPFEDAGSTTPLQETGTVYLFRFQDGAWRQEQRILGARDYLSWFGITADIDDAGETIAVMRLRDAGQRAEGTTDIYRHSATGWTRTDTVPVASAATGERCVGLALSGDGSTLVRSCSSSGHPGIVEVFDIVDGIATPQSEFYPRVYAQPSIDTDFLGVRVAVQTLDTLVEVWQARSGTWYRDGELQVAGGTIGSYHRNLAMSRDGKLFALGTTAPVAGVGPVYPPGSYDPNAANGSVYVFERNSQRWALRRVVRPGNTAAQSFGNSVALGDNGRILGVGAPEEPSAATGIDGDQDDTSAVYRGAAWLY